MILVHKKPDIVNVKVLEDYIFRCTNFMLQLINDDNIDIHNITPSSYGIIVMARSPMYGECRIEYRRIGDNWKYEIVIINNNTLLSRGYIPKDFIPFFNAWRSR